MRNEGPRAASSPENKKCEPQGNLATRQTRERKGKVHEVSRLYQGPGDVALLRKRVKSDYKMTESHK
eukprot:scaffold66857_cov66-Cyclotella_meneghiniana.AAC.4